MANYLDIIIFSLIGSVFSLVGGIVLLLRKKWADRLAKYGMSLSAGALLAAVFLDLLPDGLDAANAETVLTACLAGVVMFFFAERFLHWFHHHHQHEGKDPQLG